MPEVDSIPTWAPGASAISRLSRRAASRCRRGQSMDRSPVGAGIRPSWRRARAPLSVAGRVDRRGAREGGRHHVSDKGDAGIHYVADATPSRLGRDRESGGGGRSYESPPPPPPPNNNRGRANPPRGRTGGRARGGQGGQGCHDRDAHQRGNWDDFQISNLEILLALHSMDRLPRTGPRRTVGSGWRHPASSVLLLFGDRSDRTPPLFARRRSLPRRPPSPWKTRPPVVEARTPRRAAAATTIRRSRTMPPRPRIPTARGIRGGGACPIIEHGRDRSLRGE